jgi:hypothetical protein
MRAQLEQTMYYVSTAYKFPNDPSQPGLPDADPTPLIPLGDRNSLYAYMPCRNANGRRRLKDRMIFNDLALQPINPNRYGSHEPDARSVTVKVPVNAFLQHIPLPRAARKHSHPRLVELPNTPATSDPTHRYFDAAIHDLHTALTFFTLTLTATTSFFLDSIASLHCNTSTRNILWDDRMHIGTREHAPFDYANNAVLRDLV